MTHTGSEIVVPCYDEAARLDRDEFVRFARAGRARLLFVDDGSRDGTAAVVGTIVAASGGNAALLRLPRNMGKGEAVRRGLREAIDGGAAYVGYADADLSAPLTELERLFDLVERGTAEVVLASRVTRLGARIDRSLARHYFGRVFATLASMVLELPVYDSQCGAKVFCVTGQLRAALATPFRSRWAFDVELLGRLASGGGGIPPLELDAFLEVPIDVWTEVPGTKVRAADVARAAVDLARIRHDLARRRRNGR